MLRSNKNGSVLVAPLLEAKPNSFWRLSMASVLVLLKGPNLSDVLDSVLSKKRGNSLSSQCISSFKADSRLRAKISVSLSLISSGSGCLRLRKKSVIMPVEKKVVCRTWDHFYGYEFLEKEKGLITSFGKGKSAYYEILLRVSKNSTVLLQKSTTK